MLILVGLELLQGKFSPVLGKRKSDPEDHLWVPMIMPLTARVLERFFGLILVAVGFEMGLGGIQQFFAAGA